jgi:aconitate hydratase
MSKSKDIFHCRSALPGFPELAFMSLREAESAGAGPISQSPYSARILTETLLRHGCPAAQVQALTKGCADPGSARDQQIDFFPGRILMQDSSGLPVLADIAALIQAAEELGIHTAEAVSIPAQLVVDHAVEVDFWGSADAAERNLEKEMERHASRYRFLKWAHRKFPWLQVTPPGSGICHQLNLEVFASVVSVANGLAGCDSLLGTDSHTTMVNGLSVFGWGVGGIEATSVLLGNPVTMPVPTIVGVYLDGRLQAGVTATDLALSLTAALRKHALVGKIVEFCGPGVAALSVADRATIANMAPEYGATMGFFPADQATLAYLAATGRKDRHIAIAESFLKAQGLFWTPQAPEPVFAERLTFDLDTVRPTVAGPSRPDQKLTLNMVPGTVPASTAADADGLQNGDVVLAAITSCTNTSNPRLLVGAGLLARKAVARGIGPRPGIKTSLAPGSRIASGILAEAGLQADLDKLGFQIVGYGCTTCMGNSGPLSKGIAEEVTRNHLSVAAVLSGNRNFEGRIHPAARLTYLMSPAMVIAFALAGTVNRDLGQEPLAIDPHGVPVYLSDIWPSDAEIDTVLGNADLVGLAEANLDSAAQAPAGWRAIPEGASLTYPWEGEAGFIRKPPFLEPDASRSLVTGDIHGARALLVLGDAVTTDHISPVSRIMPDSEAGLWLEQHGVTPSALASFSARRLNHDAMIRGGFANPMIRNVLADGQEGGFTKLLPDGRILPIHEAAAIYESRGVPRIVIAGDRYGAGSARDWAAKVTRLLGISAVVAENFERIHRTNLVAMGVLPLRIARADRESLTGLETFDVMGLDALSPHQQATLIVRSSTGDRQIPVQCLIENEVEAGWLASGGVLAQMLDAARKLVA